jgi:hypothetical protein
LSREEEEKESMMKNCYKRKKKVNKLVEENEEKWKEPCFKKWVINYYKYNKGNLANEENNNILSQSMF